MRWCIAAGIVEFPGMAVGMMNEEPGKTVTMEDLLRTKSILDNVQHPTPAPIYPRQQDLSLLTSSMGQLQSAQEKFMSNISSLFELKGCKTGDDVMVPLSSTVHVLGKVDQPETVTVDIGTGYYADLVAHRGHV